MNRARFAAAGILTLGLLAPSVGVSAAVAAPQASSMSQDTVSHHPNNGHKGKKKGHDKPKFSLSGRVESVGSSSLTFTVHGGPKWLRGDTLTVLVTSNTKIHRNGVRQNLSAIQHNDHVNVRAVRVGGDWVAKRVSAQRR